MMGCGGRKLLWLLGSGYLAVSSLVSGQASPQGTQDKISTVVKDKTAGVQILGKKIQMDVYVRVYSTNGRACVIQL
jgi:hypothetical protein